MIRRVFVGERVENRRWKIQDEATTEDYLRSTGLLIASHRRVDTAGQHCSKQGCAGRVLFEVAIHGEHARFCRRCARNFVWQMRSGRDQKRRARQAA